MEDEIDDKGCILASDVRYQAGVLVGAGFDKSAKFKDLGKRNPDEEILETHCDRNKANDKVDSQGIDYLTKLVVVTTRSQYRSIIGGWPLMR